MQGVRSAETAVRAHAAGLPHRRGADAAVAAVEDRGHPRTIELQPLVVTDRLASAIRLGFGRAPRNEVEPNSGPRRIL